MSDKTSSTYTIRKSLGALIEGLTIIGQSQFGGLDETGMMAAEHDVLYVATISSVDPESDKGKRLLELGFTIDNSTDSWIWFT